MENEDTITNDDTTLTGTEGDGVDINATPTNDADASATPPNEEQQQQNDVDAFKAGVNSLKGDNGDANAATKAKDGDAAGVDGSDGKRPAAKKPDSSDPANREGDPAKKQPDPELEKEISGLGLKGKSAERFREMAGEIKTTRPMMETLKGLNVTSQDQLNSILKDASAGLQWEKAVMDSTAKPEQLTSALQIIKAMNTNDPGLHRKALDAMLGECKVVAERLGVEIPGLTGDILDKHPDLKQAVEAMDITRERAVELAQLRTGTQNYQQRDQATAAQLRQQEQMQQAEQMERSRIDDLSNTLAKADPHFAAKFEAMRQNGTFAAIAQLPMQQRYAAILQAYNALPNPVTQQAAAPAQQRVRPSQVANRGNNVSGNGVARTEFKNDLEAFKFGVASVSHN